MLLLTPTGQVLAGCLQLSAHLIRQDSCHSRLGPALAQYGAKWNPSWVSAGSNGQQQAEGATMVVYRLCHELMAKRVERHTQTWEEKMASASERRTVVRAASRQRRVAWNHRLPLSPGKLPPRKRGPI